MAVYQGDLQRNGAAAGGLRRRAPERYAVPPDTRALVAYPPRQPARERANGERNPDRDPDRSRSAPLRYTPNYSPARGEARPEIGSREPCRQSQQNAVGDHINQERQTTSVRSDQQL